MKPIAMLMWFWLTLPLLLPAQTGDGADVLFSIGDKSVTVADFDYVFSKNNPTNEDPTLQDLADYLELYINFQLKVKAAEDAQVDTLPAVRRDLNNYLDQLYRSYLDRDLLDTLTREARARMNQDVRVYHLLVQVPENAAPEDTLAAYQKIMAARSRILRGEAFAKVAKEVSEDQFAKPQGGDLGYITALSVPFYQFENAAYETPIGKVSLPVRTKLGYHLVMPAERRPAMGTVTVSHILIRIPETADQALARNLKDRADSLYSALQQGASFDSLCAMYSDDLLSKPNGGRMEPFGAGKMVGLFDSIAYSLQPGELCKPFQTRYGWHILRMEERAGLPAEEELATVMERKIMRDERYNIQKNRLYSGFQRAMGFIEFPDRVEAYVALLDTSLFDAAYRFTDLQGMEDKTLFLLNEVAYTATDLLTFIESRQQKRRPGDLSEALTAYYQQFRELAVMEQGLGMKYPEYGRLKQEYSDGILMFALMDAKVWSKAITDSAGLEQYYANHAGNHMWDTRIQATLFTLNDRALAEQVAKKATKWDNNRLMDKFNKPGEEPALTMQQYVVERGRNNLLDNIDWTPGVTGVLPQSDTLFAVVRVEQILPPQPKALQEARGSYISDYQTYLDQQWLTELKNTYRVTRNDSALEQLVPRQ